MSGPIPLEQIDEVRWRIPAHGDMRVDGIVFASKPLMDAIRTDQSLQQVANVATLPGIQKASFAMPDIHWGYGFPIGGVAAFDMDTGVVSPGGVGYDINCGVRLLRSGLEREEVEGRKRDLILALFSRIPTGVGSHGAYDLNAREEDEVYTRGAQWAVSKGMGLHEDLQHIEENGCFPNAEPSEVSDRAKKRGRPQLGTLGSGNHFLEIQYVEEIYDDPAANQIGLFKNQVVVLIHTGSRGFGHQICDDSIQTMLSASQKYGIKLADRQLCCAPIRSPEGQSYLQAMACGVNYAFANRQLITHGVREVFQEFFKKSPQDLALSVVYDVCHNIAKMERHKVGSVEKEYCVHRKGATRAFAPGHPKVPQDYRKIGQPVLIPGDMGRYSYVLVGTEGAMGEAFGSTCHGAGRQMSRTKAKQVARGQNIEHELEKRGVVAHSATRAGLAEEISEAYKDVADVVDVVHRAGLSRKVARLRPMGVIKG